MSRFRLAHFLDRFAQRRAGREIEADDRGGKLLVVQDDQRRGGAFDRCDHAERDLRRRRRGRQRGVAFCVLAPASGCDAADAGT